MFQVGMYIVTSYFCYVNVVLLIRCSYVNFIVFNFTCEAYVMLLYIIV